MLDIVQLSCTNRAKKFNNIQMFRVESLIQLFRKFGDESSWVKEFVLKAFTCPKSEVGV